MADKEVIGLYCNYCSSCFGRICTITKLIIIIYVSRLGHLHSFTIIIQRRLKNFPIKSIIINKFGLVHIITPMLAHINFQLIYLFSQVYGKQPDCHNGFLQHMSKSHPC